MLIPQNICLWNLLIGNERATLNIKLSSAAICNTDSHRSHTSCVVLVMLLCVNVNDNVHTITFDVYDCVVGGDVADGVVVVDDFEYFNDFETLVS